VHPTATGSTSRAEGDGRGAATVEEGNSYRCRLADGLWGLEPGGGGRIGFSRRRAGPIRYPRRMIGREIVDTEEKESVVSGGGCGLARAARRPEREGTRTTRRLEQIRCLEPWNGCLSWLVLLREAPGGHRSPVRAVGRPEASRSSLRAPPALRYRRTKAACARDVAQHATNEGYGARASTHGHTPSQRRRVWLLR
jgi:hypothetical protein